MSVDARVNTLIEQLYGAAMDEARWPDVLSSFAALTRSQAATFWVLDGSDQPRLPTFTYINLDPAFIAEYLEEFARVDPTVQYLVRHPEQPIVHDGLVIPEGDKRRHPYYDWHRRWSDTWYRVVGQVCPSPLLHAGVALHRTRQEGRFEPSDLELFGFLNGHLQRALTIALRLGTVGSLLECTTDLLDRNHAAIVLLDEDRRVVYTNQAAHALGNAADGVSLSSRGWSLTRKPDDDKLQRLIAQTLAGRAGNGDARAGVMRAVRPSGRRPYGIIVTSVARDHHPLAGLRPAVCVMVTDPARAAVAPAQQLRAAFEFTEAEARLAARLAGGEELRDAAAQLGITYGTARARLAEMFQKTHTRRQSELITLLLRTVPPL
jgi:DNA-binding CsgD family transcriptional regulator/PAS domain-containing protein